MAHGGEKFFAPVTDLETQAFRPGSRLRAFLVGGVSNQSWFF
jgi:hypothetical protein